MTDRQFNQEIALAEEEYMVSAMIMHLQSIPVLLTRCYVKNEKRGVREKLFATLEEKRRKLKEDKDNCELSYGMKSARRTLCYTDDSMQT